MLSMSSRRSILFIFENKLERVPIRKLRKKPFDGIPCEAHKEHMSNKFVMSLASVSYSCFPRRESSNVHNDDTCESQPRDGFLTNPLQNAYLESVRIQDISEDRHQLRSLLELDRLYSDILKWKLVVPDNFRGGQSRKNSDDTPGQVLERSFSFISNLIGSFGSDKTDNSVNSPKGVYLHGGVGCGKTFCMNLFYEKLNSILPPKSIQKVHFHEFMLNFHRSLHILKKEQDGKNKLGPVIDKIMKEGPIICFDEFQVTDVADALILRQLFTSMLERGAIIVATSNRPPQDLYLNGLQRDRFLPFIDLLESKCRIVSMWDSDIDYRLVQAANTASNTVYFVGDEQRCNFEELFNKCVHSTDGNSTLLESINIQTSTAGERTIRIPIASLEYGVARFSFDHLCRKPMGAADYLAIGQTFHTVFVEDVPSNLTLNDLNIVRRFIVFIDSMYESHIKVVIHAQSTPEHIFTVDLNNQYNDESFAFDRTRSRLEEMSSNTYLKRQWIKKKQTILEGSNKSLSTTIVNVDDRDFRHNREIK